MIRDKDRAGVKTPVCGLDLNVGGGSEVLQTAAALADATANPTVPVWGSFLFGFNGTTWDRLQVDGSKLLKVNVAAGTVAVSAVGTVTTVSTVSTLANLQQWNGNAISTNGGNKDVGTLRVVLATDQPILANAQPVTLGAAIPAGTNLIGQVALAPQTANGLTPFKRLSTADNNLAVVKASAGQLYDVIVGNTASSPRYLKIYDKATAPVLASDVPKFTFMIPSPGTANGGGFAKEFVNGVAFANGIAMALTTGPTDTDTGTVGANELTVNLAIK